MMSEDNSAVDSESDDRAGPHQAYYAQARSWAEDREAGADRARRLAWRVAALGLTIAALEALALIALAPLKTVVPYTLLVDRNTGFVEALDPAHPLSIKPQAALTQSLLAQYVVARETFDINSLPDQYQKVALWSAEGARRDYLGAMTSDSPDNPISRYPRGSLVHTQVESVSPLGSNTALVRFYTERRDGENGTGASGSGQRAFWAAVVRFRYSGEPMTLADRLVNPLGFKVVQYRRDQEAPPPEPLPRAVPMAPVLAVPSRPQLAPGNTALMAPGADQTEPSAALPSNTARSYRRVTRPAPGGVVQTL